MFETYSIENCWFCREWFCAQENLKMRVCALHRGIGKTKQNAKKEVVHSRENCGVVDRRDVDGQKMETKTAVEKTINMDETQYM